MSTRSPPHRGLRGRPQPFSIERGRCSGLRGAWLLAGLSLSLSLGLGLSACGEGGDRPDGGRGDGASDDRREGDGEVRPDGVGGDGGGGGPVSVTLTPAAEGRAPIDAAPDSSGGAIYFLGSDDRGPGVYRVAVPAAGGAPGEISDVLVGRPLLAPRSLSLSSDDARIYVADTRAGLNELGLILSLSASDGTVQEMLAIDSQPRGLEVASQGGQDVLYYTGVDASDAAPALFQLDLSAPASEPVVVVKGAPLELPDGVAVAASGDIYLTDSPSNPGRGRVIKVSDGQATELVTDLFLVEPAGLALSADDRTLLVSARNTETFTDEVLAIDLASLEVTVMNDGIEKNTDGGGIHRARRGELFGWADLSVGGTGRVYSVTLR